MEAGSLGEEEDSTITSHTSQVAVDTIRHSSRQGEKETAATHHGIIINEATNVVTITTTAATIRLLQPLHQLERPTIVHPLATAESTVAVIEWGQAKTITTEIAAITIDTQVEVAITPTLVETT